MKFTLALIIYIALLASISSAHADGAPGPQTGAGATVSTIRIATIAPEGTSWFMALRKIAEGWAKHNVALKLMSPRAVDSETRIMEWLNKSTLQGAAVTIIALHDLFPCATPVSAPMLISTHEQLQKVIDDYLDDPGCRTSTNNRFIVLGWFEVGPVHFFSTHRIEAPPRDGGERHRLFVWQGPVEYIESLRATGFDPVTATYEGILQLLDQKKVDVVAVPPVYALAKGLQNRVPYMMQLNWSMLIGGFVVEKTVWDKLPPETQRELRSIVKEQSRALNKKITFDNNEAIELMRAANPRFEVVKVDAAVWATRAERARNLLVGTVIPRTAYDKLLQIIH